MVLLTYIQHFIEVTELNDFKQAKVLKIKQDSVVGHTTWHQQTTQPEGGST